MQHPWDITAYPSLMILQPQQLAVYAEKRKQYEPVSKELGFSRHEAEGDSGYALQLAWAYGKGEYGVRPDHKQMEHWLYQAAEKMDPDTYPIAAGCIGDLWYRRSSDCSDREEAGMMLEESAVWYARAAFGPACLISEPYFWRNHIAGKDSGMSLFHLGYAFLYGKGLMSDEEAARELLGMAREKGNQLAANLLDYLGQ